MGKAVHRGIKAGQMQCNLSNIQKNESNERQRPFLSYNLCGYREFLKPLQLIQPSTAVREALILYKSLQ